MSCPATKHGLGLYTLNRKVFVMFHWVETSKLQDSITLYVDF